MLLSQLAVDTFVSRPLVITLCTQSMCSVCSTLYVCVCVFCVSVWCEVCVCVCVCVCMCVCGHKQCWK